MVSDVAAEKHGQVFDLLDVDHDGYLERADVEAMAERLAAGAAAYDQETVRDAYLKFWNSLTYQLGVGPDVRLSRDEYVQASDEIAKSSPAGFDHAIAQMPRAILAVYDHDGDDRLSAKEFLTMQAALGVPPERAEIALLALDRNADGFISRSELMDACREFMLSDDPHAPGNWLLGGLRPKPFKPY
jgi:Ca2+-binding EF-hand superfamily protein